MSSGLPAKQGLYDPQHEHDSCGVGFVVDLKGRQSHRMVEDGLSALVNLNHRGACGCEDNTGDGAGILIQIPHDFLVARCRPLGIELPEPTAYGVGAFRLVHFPITIIDRRFIILPYLAEVPVSAKQCRVIDHYESEEQLIELVDECSYDLAESGFAGAAAFASASGRRPNTSFW